MTKGLPRRDIAPSAALFAICAFLPLSLAAAGEVTPYGMKVWRAIAAQRFYPHGVRNIVADVRVEGVVAPDGRLTSFKILKSSGFAAFDRAADIAVHQAKLPPPPEGKPFDFAVTLHYDWKLPAK